MSYQFKPSWVTSSLFLILIFGFSGFGIWQLYSTPPISSLQFPLDLHKDLEPLSLNMPFEEFAPYQRAQATGHYRAKNSILLDNALYQGKTGYFVITPFEIMASRAVILVNRGWFPKAPSDNTLPSFNTPEGLVTISGHLSLPLAKPAFLKTSNPLTMTPPLWHYLDLNFFSQINGYSVLPLLLNLHPGGQTSTLNSTPIPEEKSQMTLIQDWQAADHEAPRHSMASAQWFFYALFSLLAYLFVSFKKTNRPES